MALSNISKMKGGRFPLFRKGFSPYISTIVVVVVALLSLGSMRVFFDSQMSENSLDISVQYVSVSSSLTDVVENAKWEILFLVRNSGAGDILVKKVSVSEVPVLEFDISPGDGLSSTLMMGTNVPEDGVVLKPGESTSILIWVGSDLFSHGATVTVELMGGSASIPRSLTLG